MDTTLTSIAHAVSYLTDRTRADDVADVLHMHLRTATKLIAGRLGLQFDNSTRVVMFDTERGNVPTPGATSPPFTRVDGPSFSLPVSGPVSGLVVKYRGDEIMDREFDWDAVEPMVANEDYIYQPATGRLRLLFDTRPMIDGLRVEFVTGYGVIPEVLLGARRADFFTRMGVETALSPMVNLFTGVEQKMGTDCASAPGAAPTLASIIVQPPEETALFSFGLITARDTAIVTPSQPLTLTLRGVNTSQVATTLSQRVIPTPLPGQRYVLPGDPLTPYYRYQVDVSGTIGAEVVLSTLSLDYADNTRQHMKGTAPDQLSEACAMFAVYLMGKAANDGAGKEVDETKRAYTNATMPREVAALLAPFRTSRVSFI